VFALLCRFPNCRLFDQGVGRNIAECMSRLGSPPLLLSAVGADIAGDGLVQHLQSIGMDTQGIKRCEDGRTACYAALFDGSGDLLTAVADMDVMSEVVGSQCSLYWPNA
jgi:sugar/nucleoside kinase (ribokinase family)